MRSNRGENGADRECARVNRAKEVHPTSNFFRPEKSLLLANRPNLLF
jgi:hypothetical protein